MGREICPNCTSPTALGEAKCFKCGYLQVRFSSGMFNNPITVGDNLYLPPDIVFNPNGISPIALQWLAKGYIFNSTIQKQFIGYCPSIDKVFLPAVDSNAVLHFYQLRSLDPKVLDKYKYLTYGKTSDYYIHYRDHINSNQLVVCEDHLSAIRLRKFSNVVALSGTSLSPKVAKELAERYTSFILWLDSDIDKEPGKRPGRVALHKNMHVLKKAAHRALVSRLYTGVQGCEPSFYYVDYDNIVEDPKSYSNSRITDILSREVVPYD